MLQLSNRSPASHVVFEIIFVDVNRGLKIGSIAWIVIVFLIRWIVGAKSCFGERDSVTPQKCFTGAGAEEFAVLSSRG